MKAANHIAGGIVITGVFTSLWDVNLFTDPVNLGVCVFASLLPDIDHTRSLIGKLFYPLASWISKRFGHRTITHSFVFMFVFYIVCRFLENQFLGTTHLSLIVIFALFSHYFLDMLTLDGIPLFYPFARNPCVIPGNRDLRFVSNTRNEFIVLVLFIMLSLSFKNLYANGFWLSYNRSFNDTSHLAREFKRTNKLLFIEYNFQIFNDVFNGSGYVVYSDEDKCNILCENKLIRINSYQQGLIIHKLLPAPEKKELILQKAEILNITIDSLNRFLDEKYLTQAEIFCTSKANVITFKKGLESGNFFDIENEYNLKFSKSIAADLNKQAGISLSDKIEDLEQKIKIERYKIYQKNKPFILQQKRLKKAQSELELAKDNYSKNKLQKEIIALRNSLSKYKPEWQTAALLSLQKQLKNEKAKLSSGVQEMQEHYFSGNFKYFTFSNM